MKKKIIIFGSGDPFNIGGIQRSYQFLTKDLIHKNYEVTIVFNKLRYQNIEKKKINYKLSKFVKIIFFDYSSENLFLDTINLLEKNDFNNSIIIQSSQFALSFVLACKVMKIPTILSLRGEPKFISINLWPSNFMLMLTCLLADYTHILSKNFINQMKLIGIKKEKIRCIGSPIELNTNKNFTKLFCNKRIKILYTGRVSFEKRLEILINGLKFLNHSNTNISFELSIIGDGPEVKKLKELSKKLRINKKISFTFKKNSELVYEEYFKHDIFVLPSKFEGCPMAIREAMTCGMIVVGFNDCLALKDILKNNDNGFICKYDKAHSGKNLANLILKIFNINKQKLDRIRLKAKESIKKYSPEIIGNKWNNMIEKSSYTNLKIEEIKLFKNKYGIILPDFINKIILNNEFKDLIKFQINISDKFFDIKDIKKINSFILSSVKLKNERRKLINEKNIKNWHQDNISLFKHFLNL